MTSAFLDLLLAEQTGWQEGRAVWTTRRALRYQSAVLGTVVVIPDEFLTDFASVPRVPLAYLIAGARGNRSAVLHDFPYQFGFWFDEAGRKLVVERDLVDRVFHESLVADPMSGAGRMIAWEMWAAVRVGGRGHWAMPERLKRVTRLNPIWAAEHRLVSAVESP